MVAQPLPSRSERCHCENGSVGRPLSGKAPPSQPRHRLWFAWYLHGRRDDFLLGRSQKICSHSTSRGANVCARDFQQGYRQNHPEHFNAVPFVAMFWALWQQNFSSWIVQAKSMDRHFFGIEWLPEQIQTVNPLFILIMLPLFSYVLYPLVEKA